MWDFKKFPAILKYAIPDPITDHIEEYTIEVFGILKMALSDMSLVVFRYSHSGNSPNISILPFEEFYKKFKKFKLKEND